MNLIPKRNFLIFFYFGIFLTLILLLKLIFQSRTTNIQHEELLDCEDFEHLSLSSIIGHGWTKVVYKGSWRNLLPLAVKTINNHGYEMKLCKMTHSQCLLLLQQNLAKEMSSLLYLHHPNIIKLYGSCMDLPSLNGSSASAALLVELGQPVTSVSLVQEDFSKRIKLVFDLCSLLVYLGTFSSGGILVPDLRLQQFIMAAGHLKLADLDDLQYGDKNCRRNSDCVVFQDSNIDKMVTVDCKGGTCKGLNDALNVQRACQNLLPYLLFGAPKRFTAELTKILACQKGAPLTSSELEASIHRIMVQFAPK